MGLRETRLAAAAFLKRQDGRLADFFVSGAIREGMGQQTVLTEARDVNGNGTSRDSGGRSGASWDEVDRRFHPPTTPLRRSRWPAEESVS